MKDARRIIYTDGACSGNPGPGGWGVVIKNGKGFDVCSGHELETTNNRMELMAVYQAIRILDGQRGDIFSDSAYVVNAINQKWIKKWKYNGWKTTKQSDVKNRDIWERIDSMLKENKEVRIIKVKGHSGEVYNELVDTIAKNEVLKAKDKICRAFAEG